MVHRRVQIASLVLAMLLAVGGPRAAMAEDAETASIAGIQIELRECGVDHVELEKLLAIEFRTLNVSSEDASERVVVACGAERATIAFEPSGASSEVELSGTSPAAWPRLLALAVSELIMEARARTPEARAVAAPLAKPQAVVEPERAAVAPGSAAPRVSVRIFGGARGQGIPSASALLWGPEIGVEISPSIPLALEVRAHAGFGSTESELAHVRWTAAGGSVAARWEVRARTWRCGLGPGFSLDALQLSPDVTARGASGRAVVGPWGGPELDLSGSVSLGASVLAYARVDAGILVFPVHGEASDGRRLVDASGGWIAGALGIGASL